MEVAENLHMIRSEYHGIYTAVYLVTGKHLTLIDAGELESWNNVIKPYIQKINRDPKELKLVVITHNHDDHVSGARQIREETGAIIAAGEKTAAFLANPASIMEWEEKSFEGYLTEEEKKQILEGTDYHGTPRHKRQPLIVDYYLKEGEIIDADPLKLGVIYAPGHTIDSIALYDKEKKILFTGDAVNGEGTTLDDLIVIQSLDDFTFTLKRLEKLDVNLLLTSHPYLPLKEVALRGEKAKQMIRLTIKMSDKIAAKILETLKTANRPMTTAEISSAVASALGPNKPAPRGHGTVRLHLLKHLKEGRVTVAMKNGEVWWSLSKY
ncbi:MAG: MBL fold metallo-hydrolase [Candidatus Bathyarchaeia archaeon]